MKIKSAEALSSFVRSLLAAAAHAPPPAPTPPPAPSSTEFADAARAVEAEAEALPEDALLVVNLDIAAVVPVAHAAVPGLLVLRPALVRLPFFDQASVDKLPLYTDATWHAHGRVQRAASSVPPAGPVMEQAQRCQSSLDKLRLHAAPLIEAGLLRAEVMSTLHKNPTYAQLALDTSSVVEALRGAWAELHGRTALRAEDLDAAALAASQLVHGLAERERAERVVTEAQAARQRCFTLFVRAYEEARRGVSFLRWREGDADEIVPSLYAVRRRASDAKSEGPAAPSAPAEPGSASSTAAPAPGAGGAFEALSAPSGSAPQRDPFTR